MFQRQMCLAMCPVVVVFLLAGVARADEPADAAEKIRKALEGPTSFEFVDTPLTDVVQFLKTKHGFHIQLDERSLDDVGIGVDSPVTLSVKGISLRSALRLVLRDLYLSYMISDEVLLITTPEMIENRFEIQVYSVGDLVTLPNRKEEKPDFEALSKLIQSTLAPNAWDEVGGPGSLSHHGNTLVISQYHDVHEQVVSLLAALRELPSLGDPKCGQVTSQAPAPKPDPATVRILKALGEKTSCEFKKTPLTDVIAFLKKQHDIEIQLDRKAFDDVGIATNTPVTAHLKEISLRSALRLILRRLDLTFVIRDEVLLITTPEQSEAHNQTVIYPVFDLLDLPATAEPWEVDQTLRQLANVITTAVEPNSWDEVGGPGSVIPFVNRAALVISQPGEVQDEVADLLTKLRKVRAKQGSQDSPIKRAKCMTAVFQLFPHPRMVGKNEWSVYEIPAADLEAAIRKSVRPDRWNAKKVYLKALPGRLIVCHERSVLLEIQEFLTHMGLNPYNTSIPGQKPSARLSGRRPFGGGKAPAAKEVPAGTPPPGGGGGFFLVPD